MYNIIKCECGTTCSKSSYNRHLKSQKHISFVGSKNSSNAKEEEDEPEEEQTEEELAEEEQAEEEQAEEEQTEEEQIEEEQTKPIKQTKSSNSKVYNKHHLDAIREKAIMKLKEKKQARLNKEFEIRQKAEQYDILVKSLKEKEENEKKQKEQDKIKEMEYKSSQYDKMVKQQQRNTAITSLSNEKIINDIKEQRINYLMKYLQNPNIY